MPLAVCKKWCVSGMRRNDYDESFRAVLCLCVYKSIRLPVTDAIHGSLIHERGMGPVEISRPVILDEE